MTLYPTMEQERYGAAIALLSLDRVLPFMGLMGPLEADSPQEHGIQLQQQLRRAILANREAFVAAPDRLPDLCAHVRASIDGDTRPPVGVTAASLERWMAQDFVHSGADLPDSAWDDVLVLSYRDPARWGMLAIPSRRQAIVRGAVPAAFDRESLNKLSDQVEAIPLSVWDLEMFTLHNLYEEGRDPWDWVSQTIRKRRVRSLVRLMFDGLSAQESLGLYESAKTLSRVLYPGGELGHLTDPSFAK